MAYPGAPGDKKREKSELDGNLALRQMGPKPILVGPINFFSRVIDLVSRPFTIPVNLNHFISRENIPLPSPFKPLELKFLKGCSWKVLWGIGGAMLAEFTFVVLWSNQG